MKQLSIALASLFAVCGVVNDAHALEKSMSRTRGNQASFSSATDTDCGYSSIYVWAFEEAGRNTDPYSSNVLYPARAPTRLDLSIARRSTPTGSSQPLQT